MLCVRFIAEGKETIATRLAGVHVPHDTSIRKRAESSKSFREDCVVDFRTEVTNENMEVSGSILSSGRRLISPIYTDLCVENFSAVERLKGSLRRAHIHVLDKAIVKAAVLVVPVGDDLDVLDWPGDGEDLGEHVLCHSGTEVADVEMGPPLFIPRDVSKWWGERRDMTQGEQRIG